MHKRFLDKLGQPEESVELSIRLKKLGLDLRSLGALSIEHSLELEEVTLLVEDLEHDNIHDALTGAYNFNYLTPSVIKSAKNLNRLSTDSFALAMIDLDGFKGINDSLGHQVGDEVLKYVASGLIAHMRGYDTVFRKGGDEFVVYLNGVTDTGNSQIDRLFSRVLSKIAEPVMFDNQQLRIGASYGFEIASSSDLAQIVSPNLIIAQQTIESVLSRADLKMYQNKKLQ